MHIHARLSQQRQVKIIILKCVTVVEIQSEASEASVHLYREPVPSAQKQYDWDMDPS